MKESLTFFCNKKIWVEISIDTRSILLKENLKLLLNKEIRFIKKGNEINSEALLLFEQTEFYRSNFGLFDIFLLYLSSFYYIHPPMLIDGYGINVIIELVLTFICGHIGAV